jgi:hypothetical protein
VLDPRHGAGGQFEERPAGAPERHRRRTGHEMAGIGRWEVVTALLVVAGLLVVLGITMLVVVRQARQPRDR